MSTITTIQQFPLAEVHSMAKAIAGSGLFGIKTPEQAFALMLIAQAEGRHPATVAQEYDIIQGRPAIKAQAALARFQAAGGSIRWLDRNDMAAEAELTHPQGGTLPVRWDIARATAAGLTGKENWRKFPAQMLSARVVSEGVRAVFPACLNGLYVVEEVQDFDTPAPKMVQRPSPVMEVPQAEASPAPKYIPAEKAISLSDRAHAAGFSDEAIHKALGIDMSRVTESAALAFFALVQAEEYEAETARNNTLQDAAE